MASKRELELKLTLALTFYKLAEELNRNGDNYNMATIYRETGKIYENLVTTEMKNKPYSIKVTINM